MPHVALSSERSPQNHLLFNPTIPTCCLEVYGQKPLNFFQDIKPVRFQAGLLSVFKRCNLSSPMTLKSSLLMGDWEIYSSPLRCGSVCRQVEEKLVKGCGFHNALSLWPNCVKRSSFGFPFSFLPVCHN